MHCFNWLKLIRAGKYRGWLFHRVVPNFVVQSGDSRVDGFGAAAYHGGRQRDELSDLPCLVGTVGMPKTEDPNTGGDQIFITSVPTPHLNRSYTVLGTVTRGLDVLDLIEIGDPITKIRILQH